MFRFFGKLLWRFDFVAQVNEAMRLVSFCPMSVGSEFILEKTSSRFQADQGARRKSSIRTSLQAQFFRSVVRPQPAIHVPRQREPGSLHPIGAF